MDIEIVEFYPLECKKEKGVLTGTLHVYLIDLDIDLRGIFVSKSKNFWRFSMPFRKGPDPDTGETVRYPIFTFANLERKKDLEKSIREKGIEYITDKLKTVIEQ